MINYFNTRNKITSVLIDLKLSSTWKISKIEHQTNLNFIQKVLSAPIKTKLKGGTKISLCFRRRKNFGVLGYFVLRKLRKSKPEKKVDEIHTPKSAFWG